MFQNNFPNNINNKYQTTLVFIDFLKKKKQKTIISFNDRPRVHDQQMNTFISF